MTQAANPGGRCETHLPSFKSAPPLFGLAPGGVCHADRVAEAPVRSYRTLSPLPDLPKEPSAVCSLWHFPSTCAGRALPATLVSWSPDFPRDRSHAAAQPPGQSANRAQRRFRQAKTEMWTTDRGPRGNADRPGLAGNSVFWSECRRSMCHLPPIAAQGHDQRAPASCRRALWPKTLGSLCNSGKSRDIVSSSRSHASASCE